MKVYKFVFTVGMLNLVIPFLGFPIAIRQYAFVTIGVISVLYALYIRALIKEQEAGLYKPAAKAVKSAPRPEARTIDEVVEMRVPEKVVVSDVKAVRKPVARKPRKTRTPVAAAVHKEMYE